MTLSMEKDGSISGIECVCSRRGILASLSWTSHEFPLSNYSSFPVHKFPVPRRRSPNSVPNSQDLVVNHCVGSNSLRLGSWWPWAANDFGMSVEGNVHAGKTRRFVRTVKNDGTVWKAQVGVAFTAGSRSICLG